MSELDLYQELILDHNARPRNFGELEGAQHYCEAFNPLCGDRYTVYINMDNHIISEIWFTGVGCAISKASASMMTQILKGKSREEAEVIFQDFHKLVTVGLTDPTVLGKLAVFLSVKDYPMRVKCATLAWHAARSKWNLS